jgi:hypothetical protein
MAQSGQYRLADFSVRTLSLEGHEVPPAVAGGFFD